MGKSTTSKQTSEPPAWAKPLLTKAASEGMRLYDAGAGHNVYGGPSQAPLSGATLGGMNALLAATGYGGAPITNDSINSLVPNIQPLIEQAAARNKAALAEKQPAKTGLSSILPMIRGSYGTEVPENTDFQRINASRGGR